MSEEALQARIDGLERHVDQAMLKLMDLPSSGSCGDVKADANAIVAAACHLGELKAELRTLQEKRTQESIQDEEAKSAKLEATPSAQWASICGPGYYFVDEDTELGKF